MRGPIFSTLNSHSFYLFSIESKTATHGITREPVKEGKLAAITVADEWTSVFAPKNRAQLETVLMEWLRAQRWFGGKDRTATHVTFVESIELPCGADTACFNLVRVDFLQGDSDLYALPLAFARGELAASLHKNAPRSIVCTLSTQTTGQSGLLHDAMANQEFCKSLVDLISSRRRIKSTAGELEASRTPVFRRVLNDTPLPHPVPAKDEQSNSSVIYGDKFFLKLFRRLDVGSNPDLEITRFLTAREFAHAQQLAGALEFCQPDGERITLGLLNQFVPGAKDAWTYTLDALGRYYDRVATLIADGQTPTMGDLPLNRWLQQELPAERQPGRGHLSRLRPGAGRTHCVHASHAGVGSG